MAALLLYGATLSTTGRKDLLPMRAAHSTRNAHDVKRVGNFMMILGLVIVPHAAARSGSAEERSRYALARFSQGRAFTRQRR